MNHSNISKEELNRLTKPSRSFKKHIIIATVGLISFVLVYFLLMFWFGKLSYELFSNVASGGSSNNLVSIISGVCLAFLSLFMLKSIFVFSKREKIKRYYITKDSEPELFDFINQIADEAQAPRPNKVFLTTRVNASVSYDLSLLNLIFPSKKNLEIGIGLVNVLNKGEFKSILAHEFGHFAQKSMLLGRYVYTAQQIVSRVVYKRDALDSFVRGLSSIDLRVAWIGWILSILIWAIRALIQTLFSLVSIVEKALSREMEFHADLVAVSISGSDALIHSLHKLRAADEAYNASLELIDEQLQHKKAVNDLCTLQSHYIEKMRWVLNDDSFGSSPNIDIGNPKNRVFSPVSVSTPEMWSTHPNDYDREENAKAIYYFKEIDNGNCWGLFSDSKKLREELTAELIKTAGLKTTILSDDEAISFMDKASFNWSFLNPKYKGAYHSRFPYISFKNAEDLYQENESSQKFDNLYTDDFSETIDQLQLIEKEIKLLNIVENEVFTLEKRTISHRGNAIKRADIPEIISQLKKEETEIRKVLKQKDIKIRSSFYFTAKSRNNQVANYHKQLNELAHYAEHSIFNLNDAYNKFQNTLQIALADGKVSNSELQDILSKGGDVYFALSSIHSLKDKIQFNAYLKQKSDGKDYIDFYEKFRLPLPSEENINSWLENVSGWVNNALYGLNKLRNLALENLLTIEEEIKLAYENKTELIFQYNLLNLNIGEYKTLTPGEERKIQYKLNLWDRFHAGDGVIPSIAKFSVSGLLIFGAIFVGNKFQETTLYFYNGLNIPVELSFDGNTYYIAADSYKKEITDYGNKTILVTNNNGDTIVSFTKNLNEKAKNHIYNIANAASFIEYTVSYGLNIEEELTNIGPKEWFTTNADYIFESAPDQLFTKSNGEVKLVLEGFGSETNPNYMLSLTEDENEQKNLVMSHATWDDENSTFINHWLFYAGSYDTNLIYLDNRLNNNPTDILAIRAKQNLLSGEKKEEFCTKLISMKDQFNDVSNYRYLTIRCEENEEKKDQLFIEAFNEYPNNPWLSYASGYINAANNNWSKAYSEIGYALDQVPSLISSSAIDLERIYNVIIENEITLKDDYSEILSYNDGVNYYRQIAKGNEEYLYNSINKSYYELSQKNYSQAYENAKNLNQEKEFVWFIAGSKESPKKYTAEAIDYGIESINSLNIFIALGVLIRENKSIEKELVKFEEIMGYTDSDMSQAIAFIESIKNSNLNKAKEILNKLDDFNLKAHLKLVGIISLGNKVSDWRKNVSAILLIDEKPYL